MNIQISLGPIAYFAAAAAAAAVTSLTSRH